MKQLLTYTLLILIMFSVACASNKPGNVNKHKLKHHKTGTVDKDCECGH